MQSEQYTIGWICALPIELAAACKMLDEEHPHLEQDPFDQNTYRFGRIGEHNIVIGCLPAGRTGLVSASSVAMQMKSSFSSIRMGLMVGIGGGVPTEENDIRLGDIVVSQPHGQHGGVVQYDSGKTGPSGQFLRTGSLDSPPTVLLTALTDVQAAEEMEELNISSYLSTLVTRLPRYARPQSLQDRLYIPTHTHRGGSDCSQCGEDKVIPREKRTTFDPAIHYGSIASGNQVMKDGITRNQRSKELGGVLCFEMEAAGLMNSFPCLVIRGISDYADSHKNDGWQRYAAGTAAAFAKEMLGHVAAAKLARTRPIGEAMEELSKRVAESTKSSQRVETCMTNAEEREVLDWLSSYSFDGPQKQAQNTKMTNTGSGFLGHKDYISWRDNPGGLLWLRGDAGCGKTLLCSIAIEDLKQLCQQNPSHRLAYWYFQFSDNESQDVCTMLQSLIRQLSASPLSGVVTELWKRHRVSGSRPTRDELITALHHIIRGIDNNVYIVIDALDECPIRDDYPERKKLLALVESLAADGLRSLHCFVTSRRENDIGTALRSIKTLVMINSEKLVDEDIEQFVEHALTQSPLVVWRELHDKIKGRLLAKEKRFRWADLQIKALQRCRKEDQLLKALQTLPETLEKTYQNTLEQTPEDDREDVRTILMWLSTSFRPLTVAEVAAAAGFASPKFLWDVCSSLLITIIDKGAAKNIPSYAGPENMIVKLAHFSVQEFILLRKIEEEGIAWYRFSSQLGHAMVASKAVSYLLDPINLVESNNDIGSKALLRYAAEYWPKHATNLPKIAAQSQSQMEARNRLHSLIHTLFSPENIQSYRSWLVVYNHLVPEKVASPLYYASLLGLEEHVKQLSQEGNRVIREGLHDNAVHAAARRGHYEIVQWLAINHTEITDMIQLPKIVFRLRKSPKILETLLDILGDDLVTEKVIATAAGTCAIGDEVLAMLRKRKGVKVVITDEIIKYAAGNYTCGDKVMTLLLAQPGAGGHITTEALEKAAKNWNYGDKVMTLLLAQPGAESHITSKVIRKAASNAGCGDKVMKLLLAQPGAGSHITKWAFEEAAKNWGCGDKVMALLLAQPGFERHVTERVIEAAASEGMEQTMALLLDRRRAETRITEQAIVAAASNQIHGAKVITLLLDRRGADIHITKKVLEVAVRYGKARTVEVLLERRSTEAEITEVVEIVVQSGRVDLIQLLLDHQWVEVRPAAREKLQQSLQELEQQDDD